MGALAPQQALRQNAVALRDSVLEGEWRALIFGGPFWRLGFGSMWQLPGKVGPGHWAVSSSAPQAAPAFPRRGLCRVRGPILYPRRLGTGS